MRTETYKYFVIEHICPVSEMIMYYMNDVYVNDITHAKTYSNETLAAYDIKRYELENARVIGVEVSYKIG